MGHSHTFVAVLKRLDQSYLIYLDVFLVTLHLRHCCFSDFVNAENIVPSNAMALPLLELLL